MKMVNIIIVKQNNHLNSKKSKYTDTQYVGNNTKTYVKTKI